MFTKSRQLIQIGFPGVSCFIDTPGYLYYYEPYGIDIFIHHKICKSEGGRGYYFNHIWTASDISTGLALIIRSTARTRKEAVESLHARLHEVSLREYNSAVWDRLQHSPPHKARWRINGIKGIAVEVKNENQHD